LHVTTSGWSQVESLEFGPICQPSSECSLQEDEVSKK
jgi:hypothetical protein